MKLVRISWLRALAICLFAPCLMTGVALGAGEGVFELGFNVPAEVCGTEGTLVPFAAECTLTQSNIDAPTDPGDPIHTGDGAQGWSLSMGADDALITDITTVGTAVDDHFEGGFNKTELTNGVDNEGAVSAIVLSFTAGNVLPDNATYVVANLQVETLIQVGATARLYYVDGRAGAGQPVVNNVTQDGATKEPTLGEAIMDRGCLGPPDCCGEVLRVGFSGGALVNSVPGEGVEDASDTCLAAGGLVEGGSPLTVYANVISELEDPPGGAQGWSLSIAYESTVGDLALTSTTTAGTSVDTYFSGGFNKTEVIDPAKEGNDGQEGVVSAIVLSFTEERELPAVGTDTVLAIVVEGDLDDEGSLWFQSGLAGAGQPVQNAITVGGATSDACNFNDAQVTVKIGGPKLGKFVRGNANSDSKVDIADPIWIINELFRGGPPSVCQDAADANDDELVDITDAVFLIEYQFLAGPAPSVPFPDCGVGDETVDDDLVCEDDQPSC